MANLLPVFRPILFGAVLAAPVALFAAFLGNGTDAAPVSVAPAPVAAKSATAKDQAQDAAPQNFDGMVTEILERPLFSASREGVDKSTSEEIAEAPAAPPPQLPARLAGMSIRPEGRQALFENGGPKPVAVNEGQQIDGWTVASIQPDQVVLRSAAGEQIMKPAHSTRAAPVLSAQNRKPAVAAAVRKPAAARPGAKAQPIPGAAPQAQRPGQTHAPGR